jgi:hypothetical protein
MSGTEYHKITCPFVRFIDGPQRNQLDRTQWFRPEFELLQDVKWEWTEKINGTNIRIIWDGHKVRYGGRTDNASIPAKLIAVLDDMFPEELLEQVFQATPVVLYGEGCGPNMAAGSGVYSKTPTFILFDVHIDPWWLKREDVADVADKLAVQAAPDLGDQTLNNAIASMTKFGHRSHFGDFYAEGVVGRPPLGIRGRDGDRLLVKLKHKDLFEGEGQ